MRPPRARMEEMCARLPPREIPKTCDTRALTRSVSTEGRAVMTSYPIGMFVIASLALGQDGGAKRPEAPETTKPPAASTPAVVHKLDTVVWNPAAKELSWVVSVWDLSGAVEKP